MSTVKSVTQNVTGLNAEQSVRWRTLLAKSPLTPEEWREWCALGRLNSAAIREWCTRAVAATAQAAPVVPVVNMNALKYPMARLAAENLPKLHTHQAPEPEPEPGSSAYYSRHRYVGHIGR